MSQPPLHRRNDHEKTPREILSAPDVRAALILLPASPSVVVGIFGP